MIGEQHRAGMQANGMDGECDVPLPTEICGGIVWMSHLIERYTNARLQAYGLSPALTLPRIQLLMCVAAGAAEESSTRMSDIALDLGVTARTITTMVDALEREGLVDRVPEPNDRRAISLVLTEDGEDMVTKIKAPLNEISSSIIAPLTDADQEALQGLLMRLIERDAE